MFESAKQAFAGDAPAIPVSRPCKGCLRPLLSVGIAVHATEFNCSSNAETIDNKGTVLFRRRDFEQLSAKLRAERHETELTSNLGDSALDNYVGLPPYRASPHLRLRRGRSTTTSFGRAIRKASAVSRSRMSFPRHAR
jgi:hypothetical protein